MWILTQAAVFAAACLALCGYFWAALIAVLPVFLLCAKKRPSLPACHNTFSLTGIAAAVTVVAFFDNARFAAQYFQAKEGIFFVCYFALALLCSAAVAAVALTTKKCGAMYLLYWAATVAQCCLPRTSFPAAFCLSVLSAGCLAAAVIIQNGRIRRACILLEKSNDAPRLWITMLSASAAAGALLVVAAYCKPQVTNVMLLCVKILCCVVSTVALLLTLCQPLDFVSLHKLDVAHNKDVDTAAVKRQLEQRLATHKNYPLAIFLKYLLAFFVPCKTVGLEKVTESAVCFTANHYEIYGPFITEVKFPAVFRPWTDSLMTDKHTLTRQLRSGVEVSTRKWLIKPLRRKLPALIAGVVWKILDCARALPVYRSDPNKIAEMKNQTAEALTTGDNVLVFPEKPPKGEFYKIGGVDKFQTGFVEMAADYRRRTGRDLAFYPLYIDKKGKKIIVGDRVTLNADAPLHEEKLRVAEELYRQTEEMSRRCAAKRKR